MITRTLFPALETALATFPAVVLLGPRQVGKTTLAMTLAEDRQATYLDLERRADAAVLAEPELYLNGQGGKLTIIDEVQVMPDLFTELRGQIDRRKRAGEAAGHFLLLGSAAQTLLQQSAESLAGRVAYLELGPLTVAETGTDSLDQLWLRGGFPDSYLAADDTVSLTWRENFIRTYLTRDIPAFGLRIPAESLSRFWTMLAHSQGGILNAARLAAGLGISGQTVARYLDLLVDLMLVRRLPAWHRNDGKRLVKSPKIYVRDSGIAHALLGIESTEALLGHPVIGGSWESFVIENLIAAAPDGTRASYYRSSAGAEIDLILETPKDGLWAIEVKRATQPKVTKGFHIASADLKADQQMLVYAGRHPVPLGQGGDALPVPVALARLASL